MSAVSGHRQWQIDGALAALRWGLGMRQPIALTHYHEVDDDGAPLLHNGEPVIIDYWWWPRWRRAADGGFQTYWRQCCSEEDGRADDYFYFSGPLPRLYQR